MLTAHPEIQVIFACNEGGTIGAARLSSRPGKAGKVFVFGYDGSDQLTSMILSADNILQGVGRAGSLHAWATRPSKPWSMSSTGEDVPDKGKITVVNGTYLGRSDPDGVKAVAHSQWSKVSFVVK